MLDQAIFRVSVGGLDVTEHFNPILELLEVYDHGGGVTDKARVVLADVDGRIALPARGDPIAIALGRRSRGVTSIANIFNGTVDDVSGNGSRAGGHRLTIAAHGFDTQGRAKEPLEFHQDDASLQEFMGAAAAKAGLTFNAAGPIGSIRRSYWAAATESFIHLGQRIAREVGATFKIAGDQAFMWPLNAPLFAVGGSSTIVARWGSGPDDPTANLIAWDIAPIVARSRYGTARARWYDRQSAAWKEQAKGIGSDANALATMTHRQPRADAAESDASNEATAALSQREAGSGWVLIQGDPAARYGSTCQVANVRAGLDGDYRIDGAHHRLARGAGYRTHCELKQPHGTAGTDSRPVKPAVPDPNAGAGFVDSVP